MKGSQMWTRRFGSKLEMTFPVMWMVLALATLVLAWQWLTAPVKPTGADLSPIREALAADARLIDVRTGAEYLSGHPEGAINIPLDELSGRLSEVGEKDAAVVLYCRSGRRSAAAAQLLSSAGFIHVLDLGPVSNAYELSAGTAPRSPRATAEQP